MYKIYAKYFVLPPGRTKMVVRIMKLTTLLLIMVIMQVSAATYAQKVTLSEKNATLTQTFNQIRLQTGFDFIMSQSVLDKAKPVTIKVTDAELKDVLEQIFEDQPLEYQINDKSVLVREKIPGILDKVKAALNLDKINVTGKVVGEDGLPLPGATIVVKGGTNSAFTDGKGEFTLKSVDPSSTLVISFIGYDKFEIKASADLGTIKLKVSQNKLDEVQVIAYGQSSQRYNLGDVTSVKAADIEKQPVDNLLLALEGRVPGLTITQATGIPGSGITVRIQGQNSIQNGSDPLYVVDGVPYSSQLISNIGQQLLGSSGGQVCILWRC